MREVLNRAGAGATGIIHSIEQQIDRAYFGFKRRFDLIGPAHIEPYRGYGTRDSVWVSGRVMEERDLGSPQETDTNWENLKATFRRFKTAELPRVPLTVRVQEETFSTKTDGEGFFELKLPLSRPFPTDRLWHEIPIATASPDYGLTDTRARVVIPPTDSDFAVVSDIDDTILQSHVGDWVRALKVLFINNARTRLPFPGVSAFYRALSRGLDGERTNPLFYVSSSAWNLYDLLRDFLDLQELPAGPILLKDYGINRKQLIFGGHDHKRERIEHLLGVYPDLQFILIGDSSQKDPYLYREVVRGHPGRIRAIYIRDLRSEKREGAMEAAAEVKKMGVEMLLVRNSAEAAAHAADQGLIQRGDVEAIQQEVKENELRPEA